MKLDKSELILYFYISFHRSIGIFMYMYNMYRKGERKEIKTTLGVTGGGGEGGRIMHKLKTLATLKKIQNNNFFFYLLEFQCDHKNLIFFFFSFYFYVHLHCLLCDSQYNNY